MNKQTESLIEPKKDGNLANLSSSERLNLRETMSQAEAVEWVKRYRKKALEDGKKEAWNWWRDTLEDIAKRRGQQSADDLRNRMNALKESND
jgi:hypothetical protein